ncbi:MAG: 5-(carboxyamino)imidazole ribonucleotide mutase [Candidatus Latescibacteria bacterium]|nr:5-(carboxyamino)imidazole ribonucleotide mutase [Candidatus Latescibacterota bacterium]
MSKIAVVYGSTSDDGVMKGAFEILDEFGVEYESTVISAHRQPEKTAEFAAGASAKGIKVIIAGAGLSAALPGVIAAHTVLPVIGVPIGGGPLNGVDALYSIVQMPKGIPVATVGISNAKNAALLAVEILALSDEELGKKLSVYRLKMKK